MDELNSHRNIWKYLSDYIDPSTKEFIIARNTLEHPLPNIPIISISNAILNWDKVDIQLCFVWEISFKKNQDHIIIQPLLDK